MIEEQIKFRPHVRQFALALFCCIPLNPIFGLFDDDCFSHLIGKGGAMAVVVLGSSGGQVRRRVVCNYGTHIDRWKYESAIRHMQMTVSKCETAIRHMQMHLSICEDAIRHMQC